jgi:hypothetical protein
VFKGKFLQALGEVHRRGEIERDTPGQEQVIEDDQSVAAQSLTTWCAMM